MSIAPGLRTALLLGLTSTLTACPATDRGGRWDERVPPKVATREAAARPTAAPRETPSTGGGSTPALALTNTSGAAGQGASVMAKLTTGGQSIAGTQNDIAFDPKVVSIAATSKGKPDCSPNRDIKKEGTAFNFLPPGCRPGSNCTGMRALVLSLSNVGPIANGSVLYTCKVQIAKDAPGGEAKLSVEKVGFSDPAGKAIDGRGVSGTVRVER